MPSSTTPLRTTFSIILLFLLGSAACQTLPAPPPPRSLWGDIVTITQAEQSSAPTLWADPERRVAAWIGSDDAGVHQDVRQWIDGSLSPVTVLPLPPRHPYAQTWVSASADSLHLLWLDANETGETQLFSALITSQLSVERGPTPVSESLALHYAAAADANGRIWVAWSGDLVSEPVLDIRSIDEAGRPQPSQRLALNADHPALIRANDGTLLLFWLQQGQVMTAAIRDGIVSAGTALTSAVYIGAGDRLHSLSVGLDQTHAYLFWNVTRATGEDETWFTGGNLDAEVWAQPMPLKINVDTSITVETGFNTGAASGAAAGETAMVWAAPLAAQYDLLPVTVQSPGGLGIVYFRDGSPIGYQEIVSDVHLIGTPALAADRNRDLYLAWSEPSAASAAELRLTSTYIPTLDR
jgi:hypothetical protein